MATKYIHTETIGDVEIWTKVYDSVSPLIDGTPYRFDVIGEKSMNMIAGGYGKLCSFSGATGAEVFCGCPQSSIIFVGEEWQDVGKEVYPDGSEKIIKALFYRFSNKSGVALPWFLAIPSAPTSTDETLGYSKLTFLYKDCIVRVDKVNYWHYTILR
jgi:hypothetical protein